jgi:phosphoribosylformylglycinamidine cyclo-ligase
MDYKSAGVNIEAGKSAVEKISSMVKSTFRKEVIDNFGSFGSLFSISNFKFKDPVLVSGTDGVGTKLKVAFDANKHDTIGIDLVAMSVNDIACLGAEPLFFLDYISTSVLKPDIIKEIISGITKGCKMAKCSLIGGEMAEMPSFYKENEYDLAGFAVGIVDRESIINGSKIKEGDCIIGLASSGLHSNGYSLARKIIFDLMFLKINDKLLSNGATVGDVLLKPTIIYSELILNILKQFEVKGIAHITGGGIPENLTRIIPQNMIAQIDKKSWEIPELFQILKENGDIEEAESYRVFNCGIGMIIVIDSNISGNVISFINSFKVEGQETFKPFKIGRIIGSANLNNNIHKNVIIE